MSINLVLQNSEEVKPVLEEAVLLFRDADYVPDVDFPLQLPILLRNTTKHWTAKVRRRRQVMPPSIALGLRQVVEEKGLEVNSVADLCSGRGGDALSIATQLPEANVYGFDTVAYLVKIARKAAQGFPRVSFERGDVYDFDDSRHFDAITFSGACGPLSDQIISLATYRETPVIAGRFCCPFDIAPDTTSKRLLQRLYLWGADQAVQGAQDELIQRLIGIQNYLHPPKGHELEMLSNFMTSDLGVDQKELERIAGFSADSSLAGSVIELNRVMKLMENGYEVRYDPGNNLVVATLG